MAALEALGQATILLGITEFDHKARQELQTMGFPADHYFCLPNDFEHLADEHFNELVDQLIQDIATLVGSTA